jgi:hypothetical protein
LANEEFRWLRELPVGVLDHPHDDNHEDDPHENPDPDRYVHSSSLESGHFTLSQSILASSVIVKAYVTPLRGDGGAGEEEL